VRTHIRSSLPSPTPASLFLESRLSIFYAPVEYQEDPPSRLPINYIGIVQAERESGRGPMPPSYRGR
jgi:hypothetical protein